MRRAKINTSNSVQGQITSAYGGALLTFLLWLKYSSSPSLRFGVPARLARCPLSHLHWARVVSRDLVCCACYYGRQRAIANASYQFFRERLQIDMAASSVTIVGLSAATLTYQELVTCTPLSSKWPKPLTWPSRTFLGKKNWLFQVYYRYKRIE
jgi:hypothetical protein